MALSQSERSSGWRKRRKAELEQLRLENASLRNELERLRNASLRNANGAHMSKDEWRRVAPCLHPDTSATRTPEQVAEAFKIVHRFKGAGG